MRDPGVGRILVQQDELAHRVRELAAAGLRLIDERPRTGIRGSRVAFLHPASTGGVLTEITQPAPEES